MIHLFKARFPLWPYVSSILGVAPSRRGFVLPMATVQRSIALLLVLPLFFQLSGKIFRSSAFIFDSRGLLWKTPIPLSLLACYLGILVLGGRRRPRLSLGAIFFSFMLMLLATIVSTRGMIMEDEGKLVLLLQFVVPMAALVLGQGFESRHEDAQLFAGTAVGVLAVIVPSQLFVSWIQGHVLLSPFLYLFSIYQHLQYVPVIFVSAFVYSVFVLWEVPSWRRTLMWLAPVMGVYAAASMSMLAIAALATGLFVFAVHHLRRTGQKAALAVPILAVLATAGYLILSTNLEIVRDYSARKFNFLLREQLYKALASAGRSTTGSEIELADQISPNLTERLTYWEFYATNIIREPAIFVFGHAKRPDRTKNPSAHNYFLDFVYNFGILALLPLLTLIGYTMFLTYRCRSQIRESSNLLGLTFVVLFLVLVDNSFKVGLRQPYPGILTYFLWGVLLSRLSPRRPGLESSGGLRSLGSDGNDFTTLGIAPRTECGISRWGENPGGTWNCL